MTTPSRRERRTSQGMKNSDPGRLVTLLDPSSAASEAYRALRTNLLYAQVDKPPKVILVTGPGSAEGKSTVCANLGIVLAQAGKDVLLIDCDFRRPAIHQVFGLHNNRGLVNVLAGECQLQEVYHEPMPGLKVATVGALPPNPAELLLSERFSRLLHSVRDRFDYVLLDSSPIKLVSDPTILATQSDGVLLTFDAQTTHKRDVKRAVRTLGAVRANVLGTVMNNTKGSEETYY